MPQEFLNGAQVRPSFQQMSGETMAERVGRQPATGREQPPGSFDKALHIPGIQPVAANTDE